MKLSRAFFFAAVLLASAPSDGYCSRAYWAALTDKPDLIVVGTLEEHTRDMFTRSFWFKIDYPPSTRYYDIAYVRVDSVMWGAEPEGRVPIYWQSREMFQSESRHGWTTNTDSFQEGDQKIWVIWLDQRVDEIMQPWFHPVRAVEIEHIDRVGGEIEKYLRVE